MNCAQCRRRRTKAAHHTSARRCCRFVFVGELSDAGFQNSSLLCFKMHQPASTNMLYVRNSNWSASTTASVQCHMKQTCLVFDVPLNTGLKALYFDASLRIFAQMRPSLWAHSMLDCKNEEQDHHPLGDATCLPIHTPAYMNAQDNPKPLCLRLNAYSLESKEMYLIIPVGLVC